METLTVTKKSHRDYYRESRNSNPNKEMLQGLQPKGTIRIGGLSGNILTKDVGRERG